MSHTLGCQSDFLLGFHIEFGDHRQMKCELVGCHRPFVGSDQNVTDSVGP